MCIYSIFSLPTHLFFGHLGFPPITCYWKQCCTNKRMHIFLQICIFVFLNRYWGVKFLYHGVDLFLNILRNHFPQGLDQSTSPPGFLFLHIAKIASICFGLFDTDHCHRYEVVSWQFWFSSLWGEGGIFLCACCPLVCLFWKSVCFSLLSCFNWVIYCHDFELYEFSVDWGY